MNPLKPQHDYIRELEAERDALRAENNDLKEDEQEALAERNAALKQRDALRAQLDGMTTEWSWSYIPGQPFRSGDNDTLDAEIAAWGRPAQLLKRLVGPWVEVE